MENIMTELVWKPLSDAPINEEVLVGWEGRSGHIDVGIQFQKYETDEPKWSFRNTNLNFQGAKMPTHWMPKPVISEEEA